MYDLADLLRTSGAAGEATLGYLYVAALSADLDAHEPKGQVIQDSTVLLRSLAFQTVARTPGIADTLTMFLPRHPRFEVSVVLTANLAARRERLEWRRQQQPQEIAADDLLVLRDPVTFMAMERVLIRLAEEHFGARVIDTSELTPVDVINSVLAHCSS